MLEYKLKYMKNTIKTVLGLGIVLSAIATSIQSSYAEQKFACDESQLSTSVQSHWGELPMIRWSDGSFAPPYTPIERCREVTERFNTFHNNGTLKYMSTGTINSYPVICVAGYEGGDCLPEGLLITLKQGSDPNIALKRILDRRIWATSESVQLNSENENGLVSEVEGKVYVDVESLLSGN